MLSSDFDDSQTGQWDDIIDHWSIIDQFAQMVDILDFVVDVVSKWSIFHQNLSVDAIQNFAIGTLC